MFSNTGVDSTKSYRFAGLAGAIWGVTGVVWLLVFAIIRLSQTTYEALAFEMSWMHYLVLFGNSLFMAHAEGYKGFQRSYSPRVVARARYLLTNPTATRVLLAPLFCMGFFYTTRRRLIASWALFVAIVLLILMFRMLPQPWRGILDAGVVVGLSWGVVSILVFSGKTILGYPLQFSPETPVNQI